MAHDEREARTVLRNVFACYFVSGALGLMYQVLWLRQLMLVFGSTVHAVSTVLTVFFGGLALGSWWFGKLIDRHEGAGLRLYAWLELAIGVYALLTPLLFQAIKALYIPAYRASGLSGLMLVSASFLCSVLILIIPTTLMGGTFPVLSRYVIRTTDERGSKIASLYGLNTLGAMSGTLFVYFVGLSMLGWTRTLAMAAATSIGVGGLCLILDRHLEQAGFRVKSAKPQAAGARDAGLGSARWLFLAFGMSGFSAIAYEVAWTRALSLVLGSSIYAFCIILATYLGGMAAGSFFARRRLARERATIEGFILLELLLGMYGLIVIGLFNHLPFWFIDLWPLFGRSFQSFQWLQVILSGSVMLVPTFVMGYLFPYVGDLVTTRFSELGRRLGGIYAINTLGGILASFVTGFFLIPGLGLPWAMACAAFVNLLAASVVYVRFLKGSLARRLVPSILLYIVCLAMTEQVIVPGWKRDVMAAGLFANPQAEVRARMAAPKTSEDLEREASGPSRVIFYRDSLNTTVSVHQAGEVIFLRVGGKTDASSGADMGTQVLSAHIPMLLHPDPKRVLVIGLGSGITLGHVGRYPVTTMHCAEIDAAVVEGAKLFKKWNYDVHRDPRLSMFVADGRNFLEATPTTYDVIISEPSNPWMAGVANLFTQEFYQLAKKRLAPDGVMCQWLQLYRIFPEDVKLVLKTFHEEFPHVSVWSSIPGDVLLVGSRQPQQLTAAELARRVQRPGVAEAMRQVQVTRPEVLLELFMFGSPQIEVLTAEVPWLHRDNLPFLEFTTPVALYRGESSLQQNYDGLRRFYTDPRWLVTDYDSAALPASARLEAAELFLTRGDYDRAEAHLKAAVQRDPSLATAWRRLADLRMHAKQPGQAQRALESATQADPRDVLAIRKLAWLHCQAEDFEQAQTLLHNAARLAPADAALAGEAGDCFRRAGAPGWAAEYYRSAVSQGNGDVPATVMGWAKTLQELKATEEAAAVLAYGLKRFQHRPQFGRALGTLLVEQQRWAEAAQVLQLVLRRWPNDAESHLAMARVAVAGGNAAEAVRHLHRAVRASPFHVDALTLLHAALQPDT